MIQKFKVKLQEEQPTTTTIPVCRYLGVPRNLQNTYSGDNSSLKMAYFV